MPRPANQVVMIHGFGVTPEKMWFPWLHADLERRGVAVVAPAMPDPYRPNYEKWLKVAVPIAKRWTKRTLVVAHSIGGAFALRLLEKHVKTRVRAAIIVSAPYTATINVEPLVRFFGQPIDWWKIRSHAEEFVVMHAKDDPLVPHDHVFRYEEALGARRILVAKGGHFTKKTFPLLKKTVASFLE